ncbi:zona pellucida sperm-binding protein 4-like [Anomaloglossus baeobatrachus]|uniref:zona pellucida sperm-binding protein 4-like n=1 Tax=Anomaloglossus baeobatrachus TaxID=238106 RepID=UPI003F4F5021
MGWSKQELVGLILCCSFQCLVCGLLQSLLDEVSNLQCQPNSMRFSVPAINNEFASTLLVLDSKGNAQDLQTDSICGLWVGENPDSSVTINAAYDGCYVREELEDYVVTLIMEHINNGEVEYDKKDIKCPSLPALDAPSPSDCAAIQTTDRLQCANSSVPRDVCNLLGCCFSSGAQPQCYYGNKFTAQCTDDGKVLIVLSKELTAPSLIFESAFVHGVDSSSCPALRTLKNSAFLMFQFPLSCGGGNRVLGNSIVYENTVEATRDVQTWKGSSITRDSTMRLTVRCSYSQTGNLPLHVEVLTLPPPLPVSTTGPLLLEMRIAKDETYLVYFMDNEYPITKILRDPVFLEVRILRRTDPSLILILDDCWATSTPEPTQQVQWPILVDGCLFPGDNYRTKQYSVGIPSQTLQNPTHYQRFIVNTFTFLNANNQPSPGGLVYFHCSAAVCTPSPTESCRTSCPQRKRRDIGSGEKITVSKGPVNFIAPKMHSQTKVDLQGDIWDYDTQNETSASDFMGAEKEDPIDGDLIDITNNFPRRVKDFDSDESNLLWLKAVAVGGGIMAVTVAMLGVWRCHKRQRPTTYSVKI